MTAESLTDQYEDGNDVFRAMLAHEFNEHGACWWNGTSGEVNRVVAVGYAPYGSDPPDVRIVKVPRDTEHSQRLGRAEIAVLRLIAQANLAPPFEVPTVERVEEDPFYFVLTPVRGTVVSGPEKLSPAEARELGRATARIAMWEENIDLGKFTETVDSQGHERWNWHEFLSSLAFADTNYPSLSTAAREMLSLLGRYYPSTRSSSKDTQVIHGDLRLPNLSFRAGAGERVVCGVYDWGAARKGSRVEECRSLWEIGRGAIEAANELFELNHRSPVDPEEVRFWYVGRFVAGLIRQLHGGIPVAKAYIRSQSVVQREFPELDWSELPKITAPIFGSEGGAAFWPDLNNVPGLDAVSSGIAPK